MTHAIVASHGTIYFAPRNRERTPHNKTIKKISDDARTRIVTKVSDERGEVTNVGIFNSVFDQASHTHITNVRGRGNWEPEGSPVGIPLVKSRVGNPATPIPIPPPIPLLVAPS